MVSSSNTSLPSRHGPTSLYNDCKESEADGPHKGSPTSPQEKSKLKPTQVFFIRGLRIPPRFSPCKTHSREMAQTSGFDPMLKSKHVLTARCLMSPIVLLASTEKMVLEGFLHFQFHLEEHWRYRQSLDILLPWSETISAHQEWW